MITLEYLRTLKQVEVAALLNKSTRRIQQLHAEGLPRNGEGPTGYYVWTDVLAWRDAQISRPKSAGEEKALNDKERLQKAEADLAEMKRDRMEGSLLDAEEASRAWINECMVVRSRLLTLPATAAVRMMDGQTQAEREELLRDLVFDALTELSEGKDGD